MEQLTNYDYPETCVNFKISYSAISAVNTCDFIHAGADLHSNIEVLERDMIRATLEKFNQNKSRAAEALGISRKTLARKIKRLKV
jgi:transcriptional regulator with PAS, ATPase and Fis domain